MTSEAVPASRPRLKLVPRTMDRVLELVAGIAIIWQIVTIVGLWSKLPERVPVHFNAVGEPDAFGSRSAILLLPLATIAVYALLTFIARFPHRFNYPVDITEANAETHYRLALRLILVVKASFSIAFGVLLMQSAAIASRTTFAPGWLIVMLIIAAPTAALFWYLVSALRAR